MPKLLPKVCRDKKWCIEFWDFGEWNEWAGAVENRFQHKAQAIELAQKMNRETDHEGRMAFEGHRFRVRCHKEL